MPEVGMYRILFTHLPSYALVNHAERVHSNADLRQRNQRGQGSCRSWKYRH